MSLPLVLANKVRSDFSLSLVFYVHKIILWLSPSMKSWWVEGQRVQKQRAITVSRQISISQQISLKISFIWNRVRGNKINRFISWHTTKIFEYNFNLKSMRSITVVEYCWNRHYKANILILSQKPLLSAENASQAQHNLSSFPLQR